MKAFQRIVSVLLALCLVSCIAVAAFADGESEEKFGLLNQGTSLYFDPNTDQQVGFLGANTVVKVLEEQDGWSLIAWDNLSKFQDLRYYGTAWVSNDCYDVIEDMEPYCIPYPYQNEEDEVWWVLCDCGEKYETADWSALKVMYLEHIGGTDHRPLEGHVPMNDPDVKNMLGQ